MIWIQRGLLLCLLALAPTACWSQDLVTVNGLSVTVLPGALGSQIGAGIDQAKKNREQGSGQIVVTFAAGGPYACDETIGLCDNLTLQAAEGAKGKVWLRGNGSRPVLAGIGCVGLHIMGLKVSGGWNGEIGVPPPTPAASGGGLSLLSCRSAQVTDCWFSENTANDGGAVYVHAVGPAPSDLEGPQVIFTNCVFAANVAINSGGGLAIDAEEGATVSLVNCTVANCSAPTGAGVAVYRESEAGTVSIFNSIVSHTADHTGVEADLFAFCTDAVTADRCLLGSTGSEGSDHWGPGGENVDNLVVFDAALPGLYLAPGQPGYAQGAGTAEDGRVPPCDIVGTPRPATGADMGAYQHPTPRQMIVSLSSYIADRTGNMGDGQDGYIDPKIAPALQAKLAAALDALNRGDKNSAKTAINDLEALVRQVRALTPQKIGYGASKLVTDQANAIIAALGG